MNITIPDDLRSFIDEQMARRGYTSCSEYLQELVRRDHDRQDLRKQLLDGAESPQSTPVDSDYFNQLRARVHNHPGE